MLNYVIRRVGYAVLILIGVNIFTFMLFFTVNTPDDMARMNIGGKRVTQDAIEKWKVERGYDKPLFWNGAAPGTEKVTKTIFFERSVQLFAFDFGASDSGRDIGYELRTRVGPSLALAVPTFVLGIVVVIVFSLLLVFFRNTYLEFWGFTVAVFMMAISALFYILLGQFLFSRVLKLVLISGFAGGWDLFVFLALPVLIGIVSRLGSEALFYRTMFLEEIGKDYVRTARAKGVTERGVVRHHAFPNALVPILTLAGLAYAELLAGTVLTETIFSWPGLGRYTYQSALAIDFPAIMGVTFLVALMYLGINLLVDIAYLFVDPRVARR